MNINEKVEHVFVLMLENHSFDNILAMSGIAGLDVANLQNSNSYNGKTYFVDAEAPSNMPTDPGHEFLDVVEQLCGTEAKKNYVKGQQYPLLKSDDQTGFASNYATSDSEKTGLPNPNDIGDIMKCFNTKVQLPVTQQLATQFAVCDHWYSSLPGPTWPNRFFVHGGSSAGLDHSPSTSEIVAWEDNPTAKGFEYENGSIYDRLTRNGIPWRLHQDESLTVGGQIPQVASIHNIHQYDVHSMTLFYTELELSGHLGYTYKPKYTFIEPNYGDVYRTYKNGSSQHPMDGVEKGEELIKNVYEAIRKSDIWEKSLLIITYDEHGGFYDHVLPPTSTPPGDKTMVDWYSKFGFNFDRYGVRVPAIIVSPFIPKGTVSHSTYDHTSVIATLNEIFSIGHLTARDQNALSVGSLLSLNEARDCPKTLDEAASLTTKEAKLSQKDDFQLDQEALPDSGNLIGFLIILLKTRLKLSNGTKEERAEIIQEFKKLKTRGDTRAYGDKIQALAKIKKLESLKSSSQNLAILLIELDQMGLSMNQNLFHAIIKHLGPSIHNKDASIVAGSDPKELNTIKTNFLIGKLGLDDSPKLDEAIQYVCQKLGQSNRRKERVIFYYLLVVSFKKENIFI